MADLVYAIEHDGQRVCWAQERETAIKNAMHYLNRDNPPGEKAWRRHQVEKMVRLVPCPQFRWTDTKIETVRRMAHAGDSARAIGEAVGTTRNAVIGKAQRLWGGLGNVVSVPKAMRFDNFKPMNPPWPGLMKLKETTPHNICLIQDCRNPRQPKRLFCASHLPKPPRTRDGVCAEIAS